MLLSFHVAANKHYFILFNGWVIFHCVYVPHFLYPSLCQWTFRLLPCLDYLKQAAVNTEVHVSFWILVFFGYMPRSEIAGSYSRSIFFFFWGTYVLFSIIAVPIFILTHSVGGFSFLHTLSSIYYLQPFWWWPFWPVWGDTSLRFWFVFI